MTVTLPPPTCTPATSPGTSLTVAETMLLAAEADCDSLADALHDGPVQALVCARWALDGGDLALAREAVQGALVELRQTLWQLRPRGADLVTALGQLADRPSGRLLVLDVPAGGAGRPEGMTTPAAAACAYRLVQQLVARSGHPLCVTVHAAPDGLVLELSDTHLPADPWSERLAAVGARLTVLAPDLRLVLPAAPTPSRPEVAP